MKKSRQLFVAIFVAMVTVIVALSGGAQAGQIRHPRRPRWTHVVFQNGEVGDLARDITVIVEPRSRTGAPLRHPRRVTLSAGLVGGGKMSYDRMRYGRIYAVTAKDMVTGEQLAGEAIVFLRGLSEKVIHLQGLPTPEDPRIAQIAAMEAQIADLEGQLATAGDNNVALQAQIAALNAQIADLRAQLAAGTPGTGLTIALNGAFVNPSYPASGAMNVRVASYVVTASVSEGAMIPSLTFDRDLAAGLNVQNLAVKVGGSQFGTTRMVVGAQETTLLFTGMTPIAVPAGGSVVIDLYADVLATSTVGTYASVFDLVAWNALGSVSGKTYPLAVALSGQSVNVVAGTILTMSDWSSLLRSWVLPGTTGNRLSSYRITAPASSNVGIRGVVWHDVAAGGRNSFAQFYLYDNQTFVAGPVSMNASNSSVTFVLTNFVVAAGTTRELVLVGTTNTYASGAFYSGSAYRFALAPADIDAVDASSAQATVIGTLHQTYDVIASRSLFSIGGGTVQNGSSSTWSRAANVKPFIIDLAADSSGGAASVTYLKLAFTGTTVPSSIGAFTVDLLDYSTGATFSYTSQATAAWDSTLQAWVAEFRFSSWYAIAAGAYKWVYVQVNASGFADPAGVNNLQCQVIGQTWNDGDASFGGTLSSPFTLAVDFD